MEAGQTLHMHKNQNTPKSFNIVKHCDRDMCGASVAVWGPGCVQGPRCCRLTLTNHSDQACSLDKDSFPAFFKLNSFFEKQM